MIQRHEAYVSQENENNNGLEKSIYIRIKVPVDRFDSLYRLTAGVGSKVISKSANVEDVTSKYHDLNAKIESLKALENRYREILNQAKTIKDILEIESSLNNIRAEIDMYDSRFRRLSQNIIFSTLNVNLLEKIEAKEKSEENFLDELKASFLIGWSGFLQLVLRFVSFWPYIVLISLAVFSLNLWMRSK
ncbi:DUF4349 domain-containing protein [Belliella sp. DSM 111904]|uniref:DUF4349 domain-containing protein n=1 Tax=Belliella filtrata TaxID=2923435 RepID=A0ABS9V2F2_9BACT|nr:DUF4349 domain-containing protein [Belliella filtrata]MCH7410385.1 DUF4349 domain-containing protein [Belliella filtrata]